MIHRGLRHRIDPRNQSGNERKKDPTLLTTTEYRISRVIVWIVSALAAMNPSLNATCLNGGHNHFSFSEVNFFSYSRTGSLTTQELEKIKENIEPTFHAETNDLIDSSANDGVIAPQDHTDLSGATSMTLLKVIDSCRM